MAVLTQKHLVPFCPVGCIPYKIVGFHYLGLVLSPKAHPACVKFVFYKKTYLLVCGKELKLLKGYLSRMPPFWRAILEVKNACKMTPPRKRQKILRFVRGQIIRGKSAGGGKSKTLTENIRVKVKVPKFSQLVFTRALLVSIPRPFPAYSGCFWFFFGLETACYNIVKSHMSFSFHMPYEIMNAAERELLSALKLRNGKLGTGIFISKRNGIFFGGGMSYKKRKNTFYFVTFGVPSPEGKGGIGRAEWSILYVGFLLRENSLPPGCFLRLLNVGIWGN